MHREQNTSGSTIFFLSIIFMIAVLFFPKEIFSILIMTLIMILIIIVPIIILIYIIRLIIQFGKWIMCREQKSLRAFIVCPAIIYILIVLFFSNKDNYSVYFYILILILILLYGICLIVRLWKLRTFNKEGINFFNQKKIDKAITCLEKEIEITKKIFGIKTYSYISKLDKLADWYYLIQKHDKIEKVYDTALKAKEKVFGKYHIEYVKGLNNLTNLYMSTREFHKAEPLAQESLKLIQTLFQEKYMDYTLHLNNTSVLAELELLNKNFKSGFERLLEQSRRHDRMIIQMYYFNDQKKVKEYTHSLMNDYFKIISAVSNYYPELKSYMPDVLDAVLRRKKISTICGDIAVLSENQVLNKILDTLRYNRKLLAYLFMEGYKKLSPEAYEQEIYMIEQRIESLEKELIKIPEFELRKRLENIDHKIIANYLPEKAILVEFVQYEPYDFGNRKLLAPRYTAFIMSSDNKDNIQMADIGDVSEIDELIRKYKRTIQEQGRNISVMSHSPKAAKNRAVIGNQLYEKLFKPVADCIGDAEKLLISPDGNITLFPFEVLPMPDGRYVIENFHISYIDSSRDLIRFQYYQNMLSDNIKIKNIEYFSLLHKIEELYYSILKTEEKVFGKEHHGYVKTLNSFTKLYMLMGEFEKAEPLAQQSLKLLRHIFEEKYTDYTLHLNNTSVLAELELLNRNFKSGFERLLEHSKLHDRMIIRMHYFNDEKKVQKYISSFMNDYFKIISAILKYYSELKSHIPDVFDVILRRKTIALEISAIYRDGIISGENPKLIKKLNAVRDSRRILAYLIMEGYRKLSPKAYQQEIYIAEHKIESLEKELAAEIPEFELRKKLENTDHNIIAEHLPEKTALIEFVRYKPYDFKKRKLLAPRYTAFIMSSYDKNHVQMTDIGNASEIDELIRKYKETIQEQGRNICVVSHSSKGAKNRSVIGNQLYEKLFKPVAECIGNAESLLISPDGSITLLPFEVLPMPDGRYVIENFQISYIDSSRDLIRFQYHQAPQSRSVILADPDFDLAGHGLLLPDEFQNMTLFSRLYGTKEEGEAIRKLMPSSDFYTDKEVLDEKIKQIKGPEIFHIATHGFFISEQDADDNKLSKILKQFENPLLRSGVALAGANTFLNGKAVTGNAEDGLLIASDVTGMDMMGTELVVLSACQTGLGEIRSGEGIYGLRRAFTVAGARTQIVSLWSVPDQETKELMIKFYTKLSQGKGKAEALREAQREMIARLRNEGKADYPYLWGAFICVGDPDRIEEKKMMRILCQT